MRKSLSPLVWMTAICLVGLCSSPAMASASPSQIFLPVMICQGSEQAQSLALYEGATLRGLRFSASSEAAVPFESISAISFFKESLARLQPLSPSRTQNYQDQLPKLFSKLKPLSSGELTPGDSFSEILVPSNCQLKPLAVLTEDGTAVTPKGLIDTTLWNRLDRLNQTSMILEIFASAELMIQSKERVPNSEAVNLGARVLAAYTLADNSPLESTSVRFDIFRRIGFHYAESESGMCIRLDKPITWENQIPVSGHAYFFEFPTPRCYFQWKEQKLAADGYFLVSADTKSPKIFSLSLARSIGSAQYQNYFDEKLSKLYGQPLSFHSSGPNDRPVRFFADGSVEFGILSGETEPTLKWEFGELKIGAPYSDQITRWFDTEVGFWPNGKLRWVQSAEGKVLIQGKWYEVGFSDIFIYETGRIKCADFNPMKTRFRRKNGKPYILTQNNRYTCFDEQGDPIEVEYSAGETRRQEELKEQFKDHPSAGK